MTRDFVWMEISRTEQRIVDARAVSGPANGILGDAPDVKAGSQDILSSTDRCCIKIHLCTYIFDKTFIITLMRERPLKHQTRSTAISAMRSALCVLHSFGIHPVKRVHAFFLLHAEAAARVTP